jgi:hypothetical protein
MSYKVIKGRVTHDGQIFRLGDELPRIGSAALSRLIAKGVVAKTSDAPPVKVDLLPDELKATEPKAKPEKKKKAAPDSKNSDLPPGINPDLVGN